MPVLLLCWTHGYYSKACKTLLTCYFWNFSIISQFCLANNHQNANAKTIFQTWGCFSLQTYHVFTTYDTRSTSPPLPWIYTTSIPRFPGNLGKKTSRVCTLWTEGTWVDRGPWSVAADIWAGTIAAIILSVRSVGPIQIWQSLKKETKFNAKHVSRPRGATVWNGLT